MLIELNCRSHDYDDSETHLLNTEQIIWISKSENGELHRCETTTGFMYIDEQWDILRAKLDICTIPPRRMIISNPSNDSWVKKQFEVHDEIQPIGPGIPEVVWENPDLKADRKGTEERATPVEGVCSPSSVPVSLYKSEALQTKERPLRVRSVAISEEISAGKATIADRILWGRYRSVSRNAPDRLKCEQHVYSKAMHQPSPRKCIRCNEPENRPHDVVEVGEEVCNSVTCIEVGTHAP